MDPATAVRAVPAAASVLEAFQKVLQSLNRTSLEVALGYALAAWPAARILVGAETAVQVEEILQAWDTKFDVQEMAKIRQCFPSVSEEVLNPSLWPKS